MEVFPGSVSILREWITAGSVKGYEYTGSAWGDVREKGRLIQLKKIKNKKNLKLGKKVKQSMAEIN